MLKSPSIIRDAHKICINTVFCASLLLSNVASAEPVKVAFVGDQGTGQHAQSVLSLIANEGTDLLMIQGDLGYDENAADKWNANLDTALGKDLPVLIVVGNHENYEWPRYQSLINERINRANELSCSGNSGVKALCRYKNLDIVQVAPGVSEVSGVNPDDDYAQFIRSSFEASSPRWRICSWHKNQRDLQTGDKGNSTGWDVYDACLDAGAMIAVAHEHAYSRTYLLSDFENQTIAHKNSDMTLEPGKSFAFVSGLGGREVRSQKRGGDWWASIYTANQGATHGALFCSFEATTADCYFKAIDGSVPDQFTLRLGGDSASTSAVSQTSEPVATPAKLSNGDGYVYSRTDKEEYRWIGQDRTGNIGSIWIDKACADSLGGPAASGDWHDLMAAAPAFDAARNPCNPAAQQAVAINAAPIAGGFVFSRSDKNEYRWIDKTESGTLGSIWIDQACADRFGGPTVSGRWSELMALAPGFDEIESPCY